MIQIIADTTSSLPVEMAQRLGIGYLPQIIMFGEQSYRDDNELDADAFIKMLKASSELPKTAAPPPALYSPYFQALADNGGTGIVLCPSKDVSGTFRSAETAASDFPTADIRVVDTRSVASSLGQLVLQAQRWVGEGCDADTIIERVHALRQRERTYVVVDTLEYLFKGGRIGGAKMLLGSLLQVKPILQFKNGQIEPVEQQRTKRRALARLKELVAAECPTTPDSKLCVLQGGAPEEGQLLASELQNSLGLEEVPVFNLPAAILVHAGPGVLGTSFFTA